MLNPCKMRVLPKSRMKENFKSGSERDVKVSLKVEYCDTPHIEREEQTGNTKYI